ncbi:uncharacterized protein [Mytilus edulis]|uniref:uncharacterized protein isoform X1 n=2 Tax=Mytilus edulis TaxID=6550 RepID=UPI0039F0F718
MVCIDSWKSLNVLNKCLLASTSVAIFSLIMGISTPFWITVHIPENSLSFTGNFQADFYVPSKKFKAFLIKMIENDQYLGLWQWCIGGNGCIDLGWISMFISNTDWHAWPDELNTLIDFWIATRAFATLGLVSAVIVTAVFLWCICRRTGTGGCSHGFIVIGCFITGGLLAVSVAVFYTAVHKLASNQNTNISFSFGMTCIAAILYIFNGLTLVLALCTGTITIGRKNAKLRKDDECATY